MRAAGQIAVILLHCHTHKLNPPVASLIKSQVKGLSLADRFAFASSPTNARSRPAVAALLRFGRCYADERPAPLDLDFSETVPRTPDELRDLEEAYKVAFGQFHSSDSHFFRSVLRRWTWSVVPKVPQTPGELRVLEEA